MRQCVSTGKLWGGGAQRGRANLRFVTSGVHAVLEVEHDLMYLVQSFVQRPADDLAPRKRIGASARVEHAQSCCRR